MYYIYISNMSLGRRNNNIFYSVECDTPNGKFVKIDEINNLAQIAIMINKRFFNSFEVVSRSMVSNWLYYPDTPRKRYAMDFKIYKYERDVGDNSLRRVTCGT